MRWLEIGILATALMLGFSCEAFAADIPDASSIFLENRCTACHSVESQNIEWAPRSANTKRKPVDLSDVGARVDDGAWLAEYLMKKEVKDDKKHQKRFSGKKDELEVLVNWLLSLKP